ncbi:DUF3251 domain-containing protein [Erwinia sp. CPCC 100877]|nr:DUF3251 domain-containing protein [Erwinia sp. CPCC 100877]
MTTRCLKLILAGSLFTLTACATQKEVRKVSNEVQAINQQMTRLNQQSVKLTRQNALNASSTSGAYLLPDSKAAAQLDSQIGTLTMTLNNVVSAGNGSRATLTIRGGNSAPLPAFSAKVVWGQLQGTLDNYQEVNVQTLPISVPESVLVPSDVDIPLAFPGITPDQLGFVRVHNIVPSDPNYQPPAKSPFTQ